ncbi:MAG: LPS assembly protein LptD, partial [Thermodesulfobacteriota bacterium]
EKPVYRDHVYLELIQSYDINEATRKLTSPTDQRRPFSDIAGELNIKPVEMVLITGKGQYDVYDWRFDSYDTTIRLHDRRGDWGSATYRFIRGGANYFEASVRARVTKAFDLTYANRFSFEDDRSLETVYGVVYRHQCWGAMLTYTQRLEENIVLLTFDLKGLGRVAGIAGKLHPF